MNINYDYPYVLCFYVLDLLLPTPFHLTLSYFFSFTNSFCLTLLFLVIYKSYLRVYTVPRLIIGSLLDI